MQPDSRVPRLALRAPWMAAVFPLALAALAVLWLGLRNGFTTWVAVVGGIVLVVGLAAASGMRRLAGRPHLARAEAFLDGLALGGARVRHVRGRTTATGFRIDLQVLGGPATLESGTGLSLRWAPPGGAPRQLRPASGGIDGFRAEGCREALRLTGGAQGPA